MLSFLFDLEESIRFFIALRLARDDDGSLLYRDIDQLYVYDMQQQSFVSVDASTPYHSIWE